jgi:acetolactate synthase-1/2/3 large subunit
MVNTFMAKGILPADHPQALMTVGLGRGDAERAGFLEADLVIAAGYDPVEWGPRTWNPERQAQIVHLDFTSAEVDAHYDPAVEVVADVREALELLAALVAPADRQPPAKARRDDRCRSDAFPLLPERVVADLEAALASEDLVISDVG